MLGAYRELFLLLSPFSWTGPRNSMSPMPMQLIIPDMGSQNLSHSAKFVLWDPLNMIYTNSLKPCYSVKISDSIKPKEPPKKMALYCRQGSGTLCQQFLSMHGISWYFMVLHGIAWYCMVFHGIAWYCMVLHEIAWYCIVLHGIAWY